MLKHLSLNTLSQKKAALAFMIGALFICLSCGKRTPPLPPIERVSQRTTISGFQRGNKIILSWKMPARNAQESSVLNIDRIDVYRLAEPLNDALTLSEEEFASRSTLISTIPVKTEDFNLKEFKYTDTLEFAGQPARIRYAIRFVNSSGQKAAFSNYLLIEPAPKIANSPLALSAETEESAIILKWTPPQANVDESTPVNLLGYNIYSSSSKNETARVLNDSPIIKTEYLDKSFNFNSNYIYFVRSISLGSNGDYVESAESNIVAITPVDVFPPSPPTAVTIAAAPNNLSIFFATNPEKDIAGYNVFRSTNRELPFDRWQKLTPELLKTNTFQDTGVESGVRYFYYLTATDLAGNVSQPSEIFSEEAP